MQRNGHVESHWQSSESTMLTDLHQVILTTGPEFTIKELFRPRHRTDNPVLLQDAALSEFIAIITALLNACGPLKETTISSVRLACMLISNNTLLQHLFWHFPGLSPLSMKDCMLLSPSGGGDIIEVDETHDGTGAFVAHMKIRRFRLRFTKPKACAPRSIA